MGLCLSFSILFATTRTVIRVRRFRRLYPDDLLLLFSLTTFIVAVGVFWQNITNVFEQMDIIQGIKPLTVQFIQNQVSNIRLNYASGSMLWISVYCVKLAFLAIFRRLIWHDRALKMWWFIVLVFVILTGLVSVACDIYICPDLTATILRTYQLDIEFYLHTTRIDMICSFSTYVLIYTALT